MSTIEEVKQKIDIVEVISESVRLQKAGQNFKGLCPFHSEKHGSFFVFPDRQTWHCFGACGTGGDVFSFLMKKENIDFGDALRRLAGRAGVTLVAEPAMAARDEAKDRLRSINEAAAAYYNNVLQSSSQAEKSRQYLEKRGFSAQAIADFQIGFSPAAGDALLGYLRGKGTLEKDMVEAGVVMARETGGYHDRFRARLMFPIRDAESRVVGFGARAMDDSQPKYLNSPQTVLFDKSGLLYGLDRARRSIRSKNEVVVVEGYPDVIIAHQYGFDNVVASMGTSLTEKQMGLVKKLTKNLVLALDADTAGEAATLRGIEVAASALDRKMVPVPTGQRRGEVTLDERSPTGADLVRYENVLDAEIRVAVLPEGKDPDEVIKKDRTEWERLISGAKPVIEYLFDVIPAGLDLSRASDKTTVVTELSRPIGEIRDPVRRSHYLQKLARLVGVDERTLEARIRSLTRTEARKVKSTEVEVAPSSRAFSNSLEEYCLALVLRFPDLRADCQAVPPTFFESSENREVFLACRDSDGEPEQCLDSSLWEHVSYLRKRSLPPMTMKEQDVLRDCLSRLEERFLRNKMRTEGFLLQETGTGSDAARETGPQGPDLEVSSRLKEVFDERTELQRERRKGK